MERLETRSAADIVPLAGQHLRRCVDRLAERDADVAAALVQLGYPPDRWHEPGFATLVRIVVAQQVSVASAAAIWRRLELLLPEGVTPAGLLALAEPELRAAGFSAPKAGYARGLAQAVLDGSLDLPALAGLEVEAAVAHLARRRGLGRWSAEIYLLMALGREDVFPADDLAIRLALQRLKGLDARPDAATARRLVEPWQPLRGVGAVFLWHLYGAATLDRSSPARGRR